MEFKIKLKNKDEAIAFAKCLANFKERTEPFINPFPDAKPYPEGYNGVVHLSWPIPENFTNKG